MKKQKITIDISPLSNPTVGIGRSVAGLMSELPELAISADIDLQCYFRKALGNINEFNLSNLKVNRLRVPLSAENLVRKLGLIETFTGGQLFHATDFYLPLKKTTPSISTVHDVIYANQSEGTIDQARIKKSMLNFVKQCVQVISCSNYSAKEFCSLYDYPLDRVKVINWGVDEKFKPACLCDVDKSLKPYFLAVSCNTTRKNTPLLINAFIRYAQSGGTYDLKLTWNLPQYLQTAVSIAGLEHRIHSLGKVSEEKLIKLYQNAVCVMFPSLSEGFGFPVLESLACGVPVMTTYRTSLPEVGGDLPIYVDGENLDEITHVMWSFERNEMASIVSRIRVEGPKWAAQFTWRRCAERTLETYISSLNEINSKPWQPLKISY